MGKFKKGQTVYHVMYQYASRYGKYNKETGYPYILFFGSVEERVVEGCGTKRLILYGDKNASWHPDAMTGWQGKLHPVFCASKEEALQHLIQYGQETIEAYKKRKDIDSLVPTGKVGFAIIEDFKDLPPKEIGNGHKNLFTKVG